ncbi:MAG TPA: PA14 domain-containing protein, partial [Pirellulales bacterium]
MSRKVNLVRGGQSEYSVLSTWYTAFSRCYRSDMILRLLAIGLLISTLVTSSAIAQDDEDSPFRPGLIATYMVGGKSLQRIDEVVAFDWQEAAPDPRLPAAPFSATWRGRLWAKGSGVYRIACYVQGQAEVKLAGKAVVSGRADQ